jgi:hypothetical protein
LRNVLSCLAIIFCTSLIVTHIQAQNNSFSLYGGISSSAIPIYSTNQESILLSAHPVSNLSFRGSYNHRIRSNALLKMELGYQRIGGNSVNRIPGQSGFFVHNVSLNYLTLDALPYLELNLGRITVSGSLGPSVSYLLRSRLENFQYEENVFIGSEEEPSDLKNFDFGINAVIQFSRSIANNFDITLSVRKYQGLVDVSRADLGQKVYIEHAEINLGLSVPIK